MVIPCVVTGVTALGAVLLLPTRPEVWLLLAVSAAAVAVVFTRPGVRCFRGGLTSCPVVLFSLAAGFLLGATGAWRLTLQRCRAYTSFPVERIIGFDGVVFGDSTGSRSGGWVHRIRLTAVRSESGAASAFGRVLLFDAAERFLYRGQRISVEGELLGNSDSPVEDYYGRVGNLEERGYSNDLLRLRRELREGLERRIEGIGYPASTLLRALFLGRREDMRPETAEGFERTGTLHLLALSGLHVGLLSALLFAFLRPIPILWVRWAAVAAAVGFYLFLVGPKASLTRAGVFLLLFGASRLLDRDWHPLNLLAVTLVLSLLLDPASAFSLSFQLSFLAMAGILTIGRCAAWALQPYAPRFIGESVSAALGAQTATMPIILRVFGICYPVAIAATPLLLPLVTAFLWCGLLCLPLTALRFAPLRHLISFVMNGIYTIILAVLRVLSSVPGLAGAGAICGGAFVLLTLLAVFAYQRVGGSRRWPETTRA